MNPSLLRSRLALLSLLCLSYVGEHKGFDFVVRFINKSCVAAPTIVGAAFFHGFERPIFQLNNPLSYFTVLVGLWSALGYDECSYKHEQNCILRAFSKNPLLAFAAIYAFIHPDVMFDNPELSVALLGHFLYQFARTCHQSDLAHKKD